MQIDLSAAVDDSVIYSGFSDAIVVTESDYVRDEILMPEDPNPLPESKDDDIVIMEEASPSSTRSIRIVTVKSETDSVATTSSTTVNLQ